MRHVSKHMHAKIWRAARQAGLLLLWSFILYEGVQIISSHEHYKISRWPILHLGEFVSHSETTRVNFRSWSQDPGSWSWSVGRTADISFRLNDTFAPGEVCQIALDLVPGLGYEVDPAINGFRLGPLHVNAKKEYIESFPCKDLRRGVNDCKLRFPDARSPRSSDLSNGDHRLLAVGLVRFAVDRSKWAK